MTINLTGEWKEGNQRCGIFQADGVVIVFTDAQAHETLDKQLAIGYFKAPNMVYLPVFNWTGTISANGTQLSWQPGTDAAHVWTKT